MFAILFSLSLALTLPHAQAATPLPNIQGHYLARGQFEILSHMRTETFPAVTPAGQLHLSKLRTDDYACSQILSSIWRCRKFLRDLSAENKDLEAYVRQSWQDQAFVFEGMNSSQAEEQINVSGLLKRWIVPQKVTHTNGLEQGAESWNFATYQWAQGLWKIMLGASIDQPAFSFLLNPQGQLLIADVVDISAGSVVDRYVLQIKTELAKP
jgi:hypothetical protein